MTFDEAVKVLKDHGQEHVLNGFNELSDKEKEILLNQIGDINWDDISLVKSRINGTEKKESEKKIMPLPALELSEIELKKDEYRAAGNKAIQDGRTAAVLLAGGMGTRLGLDKPKGELDIGETGNLYLFERLVENLKTSCSGNTSIPLYIMTSEKNDEETRRFFKEHDYFGYPKEDINFFIQEMAPAVDFHGKLLMEAPGRLATSPNGNGGWFSSLARAGLIDDLHRRGVEWINIFSVDNPLQNICDPVFVGATILSGCKSGSKVVRKNDPHEKMGVVCLIDDMPSVIEYYELTEEMADARDEKGSLIYGFGVILNYLFSIDKLEEIMNDKLPVHIVEKKIPYIDENGTLIKPTEPNGYKFESLVVDMVRLMGDTLPFEVAREKEFAPIKNLHGVDSLDSARELLKKAGVRI
jgi:UDP-N-acetylglucosamine/UDP-N-acetylgalactosamine diphosphorylase